MDIKSLEKDIELLEKALKLVEKTENYLHFKKSTLILDLCEQINVIRYKIDRHKEIQASLLYEYSAE